MSVSASDPFSCSKRMGCHPGRNEFRPGAQSRAPVPQSDARRASGNAFVSCPPTRWSINDLLGVELGYPRFPRSDGPCRKRMDTFKQRRWVSAFSFVNLCPAAAEAFLHTFPGQQSLLFLGSVVWTRRIFGCSLQSTTDTDVGSCQDLEDCQEVFLSFFLLVTFPFPLPLGVIQLLTGYKEFRYENIACLNLNVSINSLYRWNGFYNSNLCVLYLDKTSKLWQKCFVANKMWLRRDRLLPTTISEKYAGSIGYLQKCTPSAGI